jgi:hypothetical protein
MNKFSGLYLKNTNWKIKLQYFMSVNQWGGEKSDQGRHLFKKQEHDMKKNDVGMNSGRY